LHVARQRALRCEARRLAFAARQAPRREVKRAAAIALLAAFAAFAAAQSADVVSVRSAKSVELRGDREAMALIEVRVKPGFHVQANPVLDPSLIPIVLTLQGAGGIEVGTPIYPSAKRFRL